MHLLCSALLMAVASAAPDGEPSYELAHGMRMIRVESGAFDMGNADATPDALGGPSAWKIGDFDERPVHRVSLDYPFYMSETEVTADQYREFRRDYQDAGKHSPYVSGVSWEEATAFCAWLSGKSGKTYRLPTEAEWEYVARMGGAIPEPPDHDTANTLGIKNLQTGVSEWCHDWYGLYPCDEQTNPVGAESGIGRVVRGGGVQGYDFHTKAGGEAPYYRRASNRASAPPTYRGGHLIGFRIVEAPLPSTAPWPVETPFVQQCLLPNAETAAKEMATTSAYFAQRPILPIPPENATVEVIEAAGLPPGVMGHNHAPGLAVCPNGDLLAVYFAASTSSTEYDPDTALVATRLRLGADEWDMPEVVQDFADVNDQTALLMTEGTRMYLFTGGVGMAGVPFRWRVSDDSGATWSEVRLPTVTGVVNGYTPQPITDAFRLNGTLYVSCDGIGGTSLLWATDNDGLTWYDTGGRTGGRHTAFTPLNDGSILGMGGKSTDIDGYMPKSISRDGGKTWEVSRTDLPALATNQRPALVRLKSGRLFFAGDFQDFGGKRPAGITEQGVYVALSEDEGQSWRLKRLTTALAHESKSLGARDGWATNGHEYGTLGYAVARQAPNGIIHLISSMNHPSQHFEMNEAWILEEEVTSHSGPGLQDVTLRSGMTVNEKREERYADGSLKARWAFGDPIYDRPELGGSVEYYFEDGKKQYEANYAGGRKIGTETLWHREGWKRWEWQRDTDKERTSVWTQWWPNGQMKARSHWKNGRCEGPAERWAPDGTVKSRVTFRDGQVVEPAENGAPAAASPGHTTP